MNKNQKNWLKYGQYSIWFAVNFIICLSPIVLSALSEPDKQVILPSILAYAYTLLFSNLYLFDMFTKGNRSEQWPSPLHWWVIAFAVICLILYANSISSKSIIYKYDVFIVSVFILGIVIPLALSLAHPQIKDYIKSALEKSKQEEAKDIKESVRRMKNEL